ncbi:11609_t:CDS:10, partial [Acaulospora colombiana]
NLTEFWKRLSFLIMVALHRYPSKQLDPTSTWDDVITSRHSILDNMLNWVNNNQKFDDVSTGLEHQGLLKMASAARVQGNFAVSRECLKKGRSLGFHSIDDIKYYQFKLNLKEAVTTSDSKKRMDILLAMAEEFRSSEISDVKTEMKCRGIESETYALLTAEFDKPESTVNYPSLKGRKQSFMKAGFDLLRTISEKAVLHLKPSNQAKIFVKFAKFCDHYLRSLESNDSLQNVTFDEGLYSSIVVQNILQAMEYSSKEALEFFPRLLQIIDIYESSQRSFEEKVKSFGPVWKFIRWIPQIVAILDKPAAKCVFPILFALSKSYPKSLYYPLKISSEYYKFDEKDRAVRENKNKIQQLKQIIKCDATDALIDELERLTDPETIFYGWCQKISAYLKDKSNGIDRSEDMKTSFREMKAFLLDAGNPRYGNDGSLLAKMTNREFRVTLWDYYSKFIKPNEKKREGANLLKLYSAWLSEFSSSNMDEDIEIPGQYDGMTIPDPNRHVKIAHFNPRLLVLRSLRKPKRITIIGTDGNEYPFLVKGGEDLRLDQRIQLLFSIMNELMHKDFYCSQRKIALRTYKVVPMTGNLGIIEWIPHSDTLRRFIENELFNQNIISDSQFEHDAWVKSFHGYQKLFVKVNREEVIKHMIRLQSMINGNSLKKALYKLAASPEAHLSIRSEFVKNLAAINTLEVPELVPFRLTRQIESLMEPLGSKGLLEYPMIKIMQIMHANKDILLNSMEIFVKEPLLDWQIRAIRNANNQKNHESNEMDNESSKTTEWYPRKKLDIAQRKLNGENPAYIICDELSFGHSNKPFINHIQSIAKGSPEHNIRARTPQKCGSVKEQVECLIDLATDPFVLGI